ncbi:unnamed protein product [Effrenium voratum]|nr:unnamed protein product [Effrenium voratum]
MECQCWHGLQSEQASPEELAKRGAGSAKSLLEGWVSVVTSRSAASRRVYARLTADALILLKDKPVHEATDVRNGSPSALPLEMVMLTHMASVLGRAEGSEHVRVADSRGTWWQLKPEAPLQVADWAQALAKRFDKFKTARRRSSLYTPEQTKEIKVQLEAASKRRSFLNRLAGYVPCGGLHARDFSKAVGGSNLAYRGSREGVGDLVDLDALNKVTDVDLMEAQSIHWSDSAVTFLQQCKGVPEELLSDFLASVRKGVPDGLKRLIWPLAAGEALASKVADVDAGEVYNKLLFRSFGAVHPLEFQDPVPTFCQGLNGLEDSPPLKEVVKHLWLMKPRGQHILRRLLWVSQLTSNQIEFCPFLPNLMLTLLTFFSEAETMFIVSELLLEAENASPDEAPKIILSLGQMQKQAKLFVREGRKRGVVPEVFAHLEGLGINLEEAALRFLQDGLANKLPFRALCRLVGAFLGEGWEVILRFGLALMKQKENSFLACQSVEEAFQVLESPCQESEGNHEEVNELTKLAFSLPIKNLSLARVGSSWMISHPAPKQGYRKHLFCRPRLFEPRGHVPHELWEVIWPWVPASCRVYDPHLVYVPVTDGTSLRTCLEKCKQSKDAAMVFFVYNSDMDIVGGFSPLIWARSSGYVDLLSCPRASDDAFVFRRLQKTGKVEVFPWSGKNQMLLQASEVHGLIFGGDGVAIHIGKDLHRCTSSASRSFDSPPLLEAGHDRESPRVGDSFELLRFEVFALQ